MRRTKRACRVAMAESTSAQPISPAGSSGGWSRIKLGPRHKAISTALRHQAFGKAGVAV